MTDVGGMVNVIFGITIIGFVVSIAVVIAIVGMIWRGFRRSGVLRDQAEEALRQRLARGEIDMAEFQVRLRALREGDRA